MSLADTAIQDPSAHPMVQEIIARFDGDVVASTPCDRGDWDAWRAEASGCGLGTFLERRRRPVIPAASPDHAVRLGPHGDADMTARLGCLRWLAVRLARRARGHGRAHWIKDAMWLAKEQAAVAVDARAQGCIGAYRAGMLETRVRDGVVEARLPPGGHSMHWDGTPWLGMVTPDGQVHEHRAWAAPGTGHGPELPEEDVDAIADDPELDAWAERLEAEDGGMGAINSVRIGGNLVADPVVRVEKGPHGPYAVARFRMAVDDAAGTVFVEVRIRGRQAELVGQRLGRGSPCFVEAMIREVMTPTERGPRPRLVLQARRVVFAGQRRATGSDEAVPGRS